MWQSLSGSHPISTHNRFFSRRLGFWCFLIIAVAWFRIPTVTLNVTSTSGSALGSVSPKSRPVKEGKASASSHPHNNVDNKYRNAIPPYKNDRGISSPRTEISVPLPQDPPQAVSSYENNRHQRPRHLGDPNSTMRLIQAVGGPHFLTPLSGCRMARWILPIPEADKRPFRRDCYKEVQLATSTTTQSLRHPRILSNQTMHLVQSNDTIYITYDQVQDFVADILPWLQVEVILISGQATYLTSPLQSTIDQIVQNPWILQWFCQNLPKYGGNNPHHSKVASFPFGIKQRAKDDPLVPTNGIAYQTVFYQSLHATMGNDNHTQVVPYKNQTILAGYVTVTSNLQYRSNVPTTDQFLPPLEYYQTMAQSHYVLSPNGDRPECYRHYEALGLGTAPITQLPPHDLFRHFEGSGLVYDLGIPWENLQQLEQQLDKEPIVHRNLVLEEYWMDYVDWYVGSELNWWDRYGQQRPAKLADILKYFLE